MFSILKSLTSFVRPRPVAKPLLNDQVTGQDSAHILANQSLSINSSEVARDFSQPLGNNTVDSSQVVPFDEDLLERSKTQWQFGDWESLAEIDRTTLQHHPDRAKLALLAAAGHQQLGDMSEARDFVELASGWGCDKKLVCRVLLGGAFNSLGRAYLAKDDKNAALMNYERAIGIVRPGNEIKLSSESRAIRDASQMGLLVEASVLIDRQMKTVNQKGSISEASIKVLKSEIELLHHELALAQKRRQLPLQHREAASSENNSRHLESDLANRSVSQLGQDLWVLEKTNFKRGGFFVEFGATDGVLLSNTFLLEREFGWRGVCAEPNPKFFEVLKKNRLCTVSNELIGAETGLEVDFVLADAYGGDMARMADDHNFDKRQAYVDAGYTARFISVSLDDFLQRHSAPRGIDYISIDTEGSEYDILSRFPFDKWNVGLFTVEHNFTEQRDRIFELMSRHGYRRTECQWDDWYERH